MNLFEFNNEEVSQSLDKFFNTPGLCNNEELLIVKEYLILYKEIRDIYIKSCKLDPIGLTLESNLDKIEWYINRGLNNGSI